MPSTAAREEKIRPVTLPRDGFDPKELDPCKDFGNGAIPDTENAMKLKLKSLHNALALAEAGLKTEDLDTAKKLGAQAAAKIRKAE